MYNKFMCDPRIKKLAKVLVEYSTEVKKGDIVLISFSGMLPIPYVNEIYRQCILKGAKHVEYQYVSPEINKIFLDNANDKQLDYFPKHKLDFMKKADVSIGISGLENSMHHANTNSSAIIKRDKLLKPILDWRVNKTRWVITKLPTQAFAQDSKMSLEELEDLYFQSCLINWKKLSQKIQKFKKIFSKTDKVSIKSKDTNLTFSIKGMNIIECMGKRNIPDGELFTAPVKNSINGYITYNTPSIYMGKEFDGIRLEFKNGKIIKALCKQGSNHDLNKIFDMDQGARYIGEFAFGLNPKIKNPARDTLFDEKIMGSIHLTPGQAYDDAFNGNKSAIHWDLVKMLTPQYGDGQIFFDNKLIMNNGKFCY